MAIQWRSALRCCAADSARSPVSDKAFPSRSRPTTAAALSSSKTCASALCRAVRDNAPVAPGQRASIAGHTCARKYARSKRGSEFMGSATASMCHSRAKASSAGFPTSSNGRTCHPSPNARQAGIAARPGSPVPRSSCSITVSAWSLCMVRRQQALARPQRPSDRGIPCRSRGGFDGGARGHIDVHGKNRQRHAQATAQRRAGFPEIRGGRLQAVIHVDGPQRQMAHGRRGQLAQGDGQARRIQAAAQGHHETGRAAR